MKVALAQIQPKPGDLVTNTQMHLRWIERAAKQASDAVFFPELSLTGYEPALAGDLAMRPDDQRLEVFQTYSDRYQLLIGLGVPIVCAAGVQIAMLISRPRQQAVGYAKQLLHEDEYAYFVPGDTPVIIDYLGHRLVPAICYESLQIRHLSQAVTSGATVYLASVAKAAAGVKRAHSYFPLQAQKYALPILMVNSVGPCDNFHSVGGSATWAAGGDLQGQLAGEEGLLLVDL